jgi:hypothetical protein
VESGRADDEIQCVMLRCQISIEASLRAYSDSEKSRLYELFGEPERFGQTVKRLLWTHAAVAVPSFRGSQVVDVPIPCSYDFDLASTKFLYGVEDGQLPLLVQFSGTAFHLSEAGLLQVAQIPWTAEARFSIPVSLWKTTIDHYYPGSASLRLHRDTFDRLHRFKIAAGHATFDQAIEQLLGAGVAERGRA